MSTRSEMLDRLAVASPCSEDWEGMAGDERQRHCSACRRDVIDFSRLTAREIQAHLEASGGRLCARVTRTGGRLTHLPPSALSGFASRRPAERRVSPLAATVVTAFLAAGLAQARSEAAEEAKPAAPVSAPEDAQADPSARESPSVLPSASLRGQVSDLDAHALPDRGPAGGPPVFEAIGFGSGIHLVTEAERAAYVEQLRSWTDLEAKRTAR